MSLSVLSAFVTASRRGLSALRKSGSGLNGLRSAAALLLLLLWVAPGAWAATEWHVRPDGGNARQCDGRSADPYPGSGEGLRCAWRSPLLALPPGGTPRIAGGDTLRIHPGDYMIGYGAPGTEACSRDYPWDCAMAAVPPGRPGAPTRILGSDAAGACGRKPQLWGTERVARVLDLRGSSHVEIVCLEVTDRAACVEHHRDPAIRCKRDRHPFGLWASTGLVASDARDVRLEHLDIHGLANRGVMAGRLTDWTVRDVRIAANGWAGWDGDIGADSANAGTLRFQRWTVEWNGCAAGWPDTRPFGCWGQTAGGYGDGVGTGPTGADWLIEDSVFRYNTSDGLDLLYHRLGGRIVLDRVQAYGNAGNQIKTMGTVMVRNAWIDGRCGHFRGRLFTHHVDDCRAGGDALSLGAGRSDERLSVINSTIRSEGNVVVLVSAPPDTRVTLRNNILIARPSVTQPGRMSADTWLDGPGILLDESHTLKQNLRSARCSGRTIRCDDARLDEDPEGPPRPRADSPARRAGLPPGGDVPAVDLTGRARPAGQAVDLGAMQSPER